MIKSKYLWKKQIDGIVEDKDVFDLINKNRDIDDHEAFFSMGIESIYDPFLLNDMEKSKQRIYKAIEDNEKILIFGDYDCDGITSVAIIYRMIKSLGGNISYQIPDRFDDGYGLNMGIAESFVGNYSLIITVDNGITSVNEVAFLQENNIDVIVTDHHEFKEELPDAFSIIHTKVSNQYPFKEIAGCMVAFKLAWALKGEFPEELTDLAMIGTIADLMPLEEENQAMVNIGLKQLKKTSNIGLRKILTFSDLDFINQTAIAFQIAPKINSSGRLNKATTAIQLLVTDDIREANDLILKIEENHVVRKKYTERSFAIAESLVNHDDQILILASENFHEGVVGICAQRISEKYQKPTIVLKIEDGYAKGSARSFGQISMLNILKEADDLLEKYGGHAQAAGMQLKLDNVKDFRERLNQIDIKENEPVLNIDMEVKIDDISKKTIERLQEKSFHTALFLIKNLRVIRKQIVGKNHVKFVFESNNTTIEAIKFNQLEYYYNINENDYLDVCGGLSINRFRNKETVQIMLTDLRCNHLQILDYRHSLNTVDIEKHLYPDFKILNDEIVLKSTDIKSLMTDYQSYALFPKFSIINFNKLIDRNLLVNHYLKLKSMSNFTEFDIMSVLKMSELSASLLIQIFNDLGLIKTSKASYSIKTHKKKELTSSKTYKDLLEKKKTIDWLYQATADQIKRYLEEKHGL